MPGPVALRKQQYYGFNGNHFWTILPALFGREKPIAYEDRLKLLKDHHVALWDVLESCTRPGAADSAIRDAKPNPIPDLLGKYPGIRAVFINGKTAHKIFMKHYEFKIQRPVICLPSSSPANAMLSIPEKVNRWKVILTHLDRNSEPSNLLATTIE